jgi:hypothetical protein
VDASVGHVGISDPQHRYLTPGAQRGGRDDCSHCRDRHRCDLPPGKARSNCSARSSNKSSASIAPINCNPTGKLSDGTAAGATIAGSPARLIGVENVAAVRGRTI